MYRVFVGLLAVAAVLVAPSAASGVIVAGSYPPPQPYAPSNEARVAVDPENGVGLTIQWRPNDRVFVQVWRDGGTPVEIAAYRTQDLGVVAAQIPAGSFSPSAPNSLYSGDRGWVFWRPFVYCYDPNDKNNYLCFGETRSFLYSLPGASSGGSATQCDLAKRRQQKARVSRNVAQRRFSQAQNVGERKAWRRKLNSAVRDLRQATRETKRAC